MTGLLVLLWYNLKLREIPFRLDHSFMTLIHRINLVLYIVGRPRAALPTPL